MVDCKPWLQIPHSPGVMPFCNVLLLFLPSGGEIYFCILSCDLFWPIEHGRGDIVQASGNISSSRFYAPGIHLPHEKIPASLLKSPHGELRRPRGKPKATVIRGLPVPSWSAAWPQNTWRNPQVPHGAQTSCQAQNCERIYGGCFKPLSSGVVCYVAVDNEREV